jgi:hypothetical protein
MYLCFFCHTLISTLIYSILHAPLIEIEANKYNKQHRAKQQEVEGWKFGVDGQPAIFEKGGYDTFTLSL